MLDDRVFFSMPHLPFAAAALLAMTIACSSPTRSTAEQRSALRLDSAGVAAELTIARVNVTWSRGFREAGRWFSWEAPTTECNVHASLVVKKEGAAELRSSFTLETDPPKRLYMDEEACRRRFSDAKATGCAKDGVIVVDLDGQREAIAASAGVLFRVDLPSEGSCEDVVARQPRAVLLAALSGSEGMCPRLLAAGDLEAATLCFVDYHTRASSSVTKEGLLRLVEGAERGEQTSDERAPWLAGLAKGAKGATDLEAALYSLLLAEPGLAKRFDTGENARIALAFTPSRARRLAYLDAALARCRAGTFAPWQAQLAGVAAGAVEAKLGRSIATACDVELVAPDTWFGSRLK